ncbi:MAG: hypothetical protein WC867_06505 [Candidatus Pacearchaeota archaeon]
MNKKANFALMLIILILALILTIFFIGYYGEKEAQKIGATCNWGIKDWFCWAFTKVEIVRG